MPRRDAVDRLRDILAARAKASSPRWSSRFAPCSRSGARRTRTGSRPGIGFGFIASGALRLPAGIDRGVRIGEHVGRADGRPEVTVLVGDSEPLEAYALRSNSRCSHRHNSTLPFPEPGHQRVPTSFNAGTPQRRGRDSLRCSRPSGAALLGTSVRILGGSAARHASWFVVGPTVRTL